MRPTMPGSRIHQRDAISACPQAPVRVRRVNWVLVLLNAIVPVLLGAGVPLLALSPTLNPADLLLGRYRYQDAPELLGMTQPKAIQALVREGLSSSSAFAFSANTRSTSAGIRSP